MPCRKVRDVDRVLAARQVRRFELDDLRDPGVVSAAVPVEVAVGAIEVHPESAVVSPARPGIRWLCLRGGYLLNARIGEEQLDRPSNVKADQAPSFRVRITADPW